MNKAPTYLKALLIGIVLLFVMVFYSPWLKAPTDFGGPPPSGYEPRSIVTYYHAKGGTNDDTAVFQLALNSGYPIYVDKKLSPYTVSNLILTNGSCMYGHGARIIFKTNSTGFMISGTSTISNLFLSGLVFEGQKYGFTGFGIDGFFTYPFDYTPGFLGIKKTVNMDRNAIVISTASINSYVQNCQVNGFAGTGFRFIGAAATPQPEFKGLTIANNNATLCWQGLCWTNNAEYTTPNNCSTEACGQGMAYYSGNNFTTGGQHVRDGVGIMLDGIVDANPAHTTTEGATINHCYMAVQANGIQNGYIFNGCNVLGGSGLVFTNCTGVSYQNGSFSGGNTFKSINSSDIIVDGTGIGTNSGINYFIRNAALAPLVVVTPNSGVIVMSENRPYDRSGAGGNFFSYTNGWANVFSTSNYFGDLRLTSSGGFTATTNSTAPANTTTIRAWLTVTSSAGGVFKSPLYQ